MRSTRSHNLAMMMAVVGGMAMSSGVPMLVMKRREELAPVTEADYQRIDKAEAKRARKAQIRRSGK